MDREKFIRELFENNYSLLVREAYRYVCDEAAAQDLVQDTFLLAVLHINTLLTHENPEAWLSVTLRSCCSNYRQLNANTPIPIEALDSIAAESAHAIWELFPSELSDSERAILYMRFKEDLSFREIGERLGASETACRVRLFRLIRKCRKLMKD